MCASHTLTISELAGYSAKLLHRAADRKEEGQPVGPLMERLMDIDGGEGDKPGASGLLGEKIQNILATLVAGHDTTACVALEHCYTTSPKT